MSAARYKRVGLHYIAIFKTGHCKRDTCHPQGTQKTLKSKSSVTNLG